jgi:hypothetical protein
LQLKLIVPLPTSINKLYINQYNPHTKVFTGKTIMSEEGRKRKTEIQKEAKRQMKDQNWDYEYTKDNYVYMDMYITFNRKGRDDNNILKLLNDSLEGIVYENDSRVLTRTQRILYDKDNPRVELIFTPVDYIGIFNDANQFKQFEKRCKTCRRYSRNCSILRKAIEGRVQDEIQDLVCLKYQEKKG